MTEYTPGEPDSWTWPDEDCLDCGMCEHCIDRSIACAEEAVNDQTSEEIAVLREQLNVATRRAQAWRDVALGVRHQFGLAMALLGEADAHLITLAEKEGWVIRPQYVAVARDLSARINGMVEGAKVPVPDELAEEFREIEREVSP